MTRETAHGIRVKPDQTLARIRRGMGAHHRGSPEEWRQGLGEDEREEMRSLGRRLVVLASDYIGQPRERRRLVAGAREVGASYGRTLAGHGTPFSTLLEAFLFFRHLLEEAVLGRGSGAGAGAEGRRLLSGLLDKVLLAAVAGYEESTPPTFGIPRLVADHSERVAGDTATDQIVKPGAGAGDKPPRYERIHRSQIEGEQGQHNCGTGRYGVSDGPDRA